MAALGSSVFRTTGFNSIRTLAARRQYLQAISGNRLAGLALELRLRGKSTRQSHGSPIFYVDITVLGGIALELALQQARELDELRQASGFDQAAVYATACLGFANGALEDSEDEGSAIVDEFFPESATDTPASPEPQPTGTAPPLLTDKPRPTISTLLRERAEARNPSSELELPTPGSVLPINNPNSTRTESAPCPFSPAMSAKPFVLAMTSRSPFFTSRATRCVSASLRLRTSRCIAMRSISVSRLPRASRPDHSPHEVPP